jgi:hypothetical protein
MYSIRAGAVRDKVNVYAEQISFKNTEDAKEWPVSCDTFLSREDA